jgi:hypothetical protein
MMDYPKDFSVQSAGLEHYAGYVDKGPDYLIQYFRSNPDKAKLVLGQSYDNGYTPSTFVEEHKQKYRVGWFDSDREFLTEFDTLEEAIADYVLFSFGKERIFR